MKMINTGREWAFFCYRKVRQNTLESVSGDMVLGQIQYFKKSQLRKKVHGGSMKRKLLTKIKCVLAYTCTCILLTTAAEV